MNNNLGGRSGSKSWPWGGAGGERPFASTPTPVRRPVPRFRRCDVAHIIIIDPYKVVLYAGVGVWVVGRRIHQQRQSIIIGRADCRARLLHGTENLAGAGLAARRVLAERPLHRRPSSPFDPVEVTTTFATQVPRRRPPPRPFKDLFPGHDDASTRLAGSMSLAPGWTEHRGALRSVKLHKVERRLTSFDRHSSDRPILLLQRPDERVDLRQTDRRRFLLVDDGRRTRQEEKGEAPTEGAHPRDRLAQGHDDRRQRLLLASEDQSQLLDCA